MNDVVVVVPVAEPWCSRFATRVATEAMDQDERACEPEWLCRELSAIAFSIWKNTSAAQKLQEVKDLSVTETVKRHKRRAVMANGLVHWIPLCNSERPALVWESVQEHQSCEAVQELLDLYCAMSLPQATDMQLSLVREGR